MTTLVIIGIMILLGAGVLLFMKDKSEDGVSNSEEISPLEEKDWEMPVLDGTSSEPSEGPDMSKFPGWTTEQVQKYLDAGWNEDQLADWYKQQVEDNSA